MIGLSSWGFSVGRIAGIEVRIHWMLLLFWAYQLDGVLRASGEGSRSMALVYWFVLVGAVFLSILLHEFGHAFAARRVGGYADEILLWPLGGLAYCRCPQNWRAHLFVAAAGPAVTAVIAAVGWGVFFLSDRWLLPHVVESNLLAGAYLSLRHVILYWNPLILIFNLIPLFPLDGGRVVHSALWGYFSHRSGFGWGGLGRANQATLIVSRVTAVAGIVYAATRPDGPDMFLIVIFIWALLGAETLRHGDAV